MGESSELAGLVLKLSEIVARQREELELTRADLEVLAHSASTNTAAIKERLSKAEKAIIEDYPRTISERFDKVEARLDEIFSRLSGLSSKIASIDSRLEEHRREGEEGKKYDSALQTLSGARSRLSMELLKSLE